MSRLPLACLALPLLAVAAEPAGEPRPLDPPPGAEEAVRAADLALDRATAAHDRAAFAALLAPDTYWCSDGTPVIGPEAVLRDWDPLFQPGGPALRWAPDRAEVAVSADLGFTEGQWRLAARDAQGKPIEATGRYVTVWTRGADGAWRVLIDAALRPPRGAAPPDLIRSADRRATSASGELRVEAGRYTRGGTDEAGMYLLVVRAKPGRDEVLVETLVPVRPAK